MKAKFTRWFNSKNFRNFSASEFTNYFEVTRRGATNAYPPDHTWNTIVLPLRIVDDLRDHFGKPCVILSSYRNEAYNKACGGARLSQHRYFRALDIAVAGIPPVEVYNLLLKWRRERRFTGGIGLYSTFVHIDTRGTNATWGNV